MPRPVNARATALLVALVLLVPAGCTRAPETRPPAGDGPPRTAGSPPTAPTPSAALVQAQLGEAVELRGHDADLRVRVTLLRVFDPAEPDPSVPPDRGNRLVSVQVRLENVGEAVYRDAPANGAKVEDERGRAYDAEFTDSRSCRPFRGAAVRLRAGSERTGCVTFQLPEAERPSAFTFALDSGFGPERARWRL